MWQCKVQCQQFKNFSALTHPAHKILSDEVFGCQWHQLDHMQVICTSLQTLTDNLASTSSLMFLGPDAVATASKCWRKSWATMLKVLYSESPLFSRFGILQFELLLHGVMALSEVADFHLEVSVATGFFQHLSVTSCSSSGYVMSSKHQTLWYTVKCSLKQRWWSLVNSIHQLWKHEHLLNCNSTECILSMIICSASDRLSFDKSALYFWLCCVLLIDFSADLLMIMFN